MEPSVDDVVALLLRKMIKRRILTLDDVDEITMWSPDWDKLVLERDHDTQELIK